MFVNGYMNCLTCDQILRSHISIPFIMAPKYFKFILLISSFSPLLAYSQNGSLPEIFMEIDGDPQIIRCQNKLEVNNQGGHLQGVQLLIKDQVEYAILSGSSGTYAYYAVAKLDNQNHVLSVNELMQKPFKHAGGIQIFQDLMVVGIEDNDAKDKSKVCIYKIENPDKPPVQPLVMMERYGEPFRSTAGCIAVTKIGDRYLIIVGDWDTKHLDFYLCEVPSLKQKLEAFEKVYTIDTEKIDRSAWLDEEWDSYQNINLLNDTEGKLYLFGFGRNVQNENIADLFLVEHKDLREFNLRKLVSRKFNCKEGADFRSGAGIFLQPDGKLKVISCGSHINNSLVLNLFD